jgi:hypothetical protein
VQALVNIKMILRAVEKLGISGIDKFLLICQENYFPLSQFNGSWIELNNVIN